jgi:glutamate-1-semialdehyde 2,1-aminomutase
MRHLSSDVEGTADSAMLHGTLNGNPVAAAAGVATLTELSKPDAYQRLFATGDRLRQGLAAAARGAGLPAQVVGESSVFEIYFTDRSVTDYRATLTADMEQHRAFTRALLERGVTKAAQKFYVSLAHGDAEVEQTLKIFAEALRAVAEHAAPGGGGSRRHGPLAERP